VWLQASRGTELSQPRDFGERFDKLTTPRKIEGLSRAVEPRLGHIS